MRTKNLRRRVILFWTLVITVGIFMAISSITLVKATPTSSSSNPIESTDITMLALSSSLTTIVCGAAAAYALARSGSAAISALVEKPETFFKAFLVVTLCEAIAIYGLVISVLLWTKIP